MIPRLLSDPSVPKPLLWFRIGVASERRGRSHIERRKRIKGQTGEEEQKGQEGQEGQKGKER
jgi:hypothetical protein